MNQERKRPRKNSIYWEIYKNKRDEPNILCFNNELRYGGNLTFCVMEYSADLVGDIFFKTEFQEDGQAVSDGLQVHPIWEYQHAPRHTLEVYKPKAVQGLKNRCKVLVQMYVIDREHSKKILFKELTFQPRIQRSIIQNDGVPKFERAEPVIINVEESLHMWIPVENYELIPTRKPYSARKRRSPKRLSKRKVQLLEDDNTFEQEERPNKIMKEESPRYYGQPFDISTTVPSGELQEASSNDFETELESNNFWFTLTN